jgi:hypothetical protein
MNAKRKRPKSKRHGGEQRRVVRHAANDDVPKSEPQPRRPERDAGATAYWVIRILLLVWDLIRGDHPLF